MNMTTNQVSDPLQRLLHRLADDAISTAEGWKKKAAEIPNMRAWSEEFKATQTQKMAVEAGQDLRRRYADAARSHADTAAKDAADVVARRSWLDADRLSDARSRYGGTLAGMIARDAFAAVKAFTEHGDGEAAAVAGDALQARLAAHPDRVIAAELDGIRTDPGTPEGQARRKVTQAAKGLEYADVLGRYADAVAGTISGDREQASREPIFAGVLRGFRWDAPPHPNPSGVRRDR